MLLQNRGALNHRKRGANFCRLDSPCGAGTGWLGRKGSNLRMLESKSSALPLGDAPAGPGQAPGGTRIKRAGPGRKPPKMPLAQGFAIGLWPVAGAGGPRYKGASRGEGFLLRTGSESSSAW